MAPSGGRQLAFFHRLYCNKSCRPRQRMKLIKSHSQYTVIHSRRFLFFTVAHHDGTQIQLYSNQLTCNSRFYAFFGGSCQLANFFHKTFISLIFYRNAPADIVKLCEHNFFSRKHRLLVSCVSALRAKVLYRKTALYTALAAPSASPRRQLFPLYDPNNPLIMPHRGSSLSRPLGSRHEGDPMVRPMSSCRSTRSRASVPPTKPNLACSPTP